MRLFSFSLLIGGGAVLSHLYLYQRLVRPLALDRRLRRGVIGLLTVMTALLLMRGPLRGLDLGLRYAYEILSYSWIALVLGMVCAVAIGDVITLVFSIGRHGLRRARPTPPLHQPVATDKSPVNIDEGRRRIARALPLTILAGGGITAAYGSLRAFAPAEVSDVAIKLPRLPRSLDGLTIAQLTDIHVGNFIRRPFIERLVAQTNAVAPDVVAITGDLVDGSVAQLGSVVSALRGLKARYGVYFVTGNHEYHSDADAWAGFLESIGISVLRNRSVPIGDGGGTFDLVGVDDWGGGRRPGGKGYDLDAALRGRNPEHATVLLAHQPRNFEQAVARGVGLQLSGHTHGGQVFPMTMLVGLEFDYSRGLYQHADGQIYVSRGCGFWGPPSRIGSAPEIVKFTLMA